MLTPDIDVYAGALYCQRQCLKRLNTKPRGRATCKE